MGNSVHSIIKNEYEKKRNMAYDRFLGKEAEIFSKIPEIEAIESRIRLSGLKYNRMLLQGIQSEDEIIKALLSEIDALKKEKASLLERAGYSSAYLEMAYECASCQDTGYIEKDNASERCFCYTQRLLNNIFSQSNLKLTESENFSSFDENVFSDQVDEGQYGTDSSPRQNILEIREECKDFISRFTNPNEKSLFFSGPTGIGKTFMANCIAYELLNRGHSVLYLTAPMLFNTINEFRTKSFKNEEFEDAAYKRIFDVNLLIIDDLGTEAPSAARYAELLTILNNRKINDAIRPCKMIISTNVGIKKLHEYYDERIMSRIMGCFDMYRFFGEDIRKRRVLQTNT